MVVICAVCQKFIREKEPLEDTAITHGYCTVHYQEALEQVKEVRIQTTFQEELPMT